jgi:hypothetical protein
LVDKIIREFMKLKIRKSWISVSSAVAMSALLMIGCGSSGPNRTDVSTVPKVAMPVAVKPNAGETHARAVKRMFNMARPGLPGN